MNHQLSIPMQIQKQERDAHENKGRNSCQQGKIINGSQSLAIDSPCSNEPWPEDQRDQRTKKKHQQAPDRCVKNAICRLEVRDVENPG